MKKISDKGIKLLDKLEDCRLQIYLDSAGLPTIGVGHLITSDREKAEFKDGIDRERAMELLREDMNDVELIVNAKVEVEISQEKFDALVIFAFNIGNGGFASSTALAKINQGRPLDEIEPWWKAWNKITLKGKKQVSKGLENRRATEWVLYSEGIYSA